MIRLVLRALVSGLLAISSSLAGEGSWADLLNQGQQFKEQGRYRDAEAAFEGSLALAEQSLQPEAVAQSMNLWAQVKQIRGDYAPADALYKDAIEILKQHPDDRLLAAVLLNNARLDAVEGKFGEAEALAQQSLFLHERL